MAKFFINNGQISAIQKNTEDVCIFFDNGKHLLISSDYLIPEGFIQFTEKIYINPQKLLYLKNNFIEVENNTKKFTKKITVTLAGGEFFNKIHEPNYKEVWGNLLKQLKKALKV